MCVCYSKILKYAVCNKGKYYAVLLQSTEERTDQENVSPRTESVNPMSGDTRSTEKQLRDEIDRLKLALEERLAIVIDLDGSSDIIF